MKPHPYSDNFVARIHAGLAIRDADQCWIWTRTTDRHGYGDIKYRQKHVAVHRAMYEIHRGPIPDGLTVDHIACSTRACGNPHHLRICTWSENLLHRGPNRGSKSKTRNVAFNSKPGLKKPWHVKLMVRGELVISEYFETKEEAVVAAHAARVRFLGWDGSNRAAA